MSQPLSNDQNMDRTTIWTRRRRRALPSHPGSKRAAPADDRSVLPKTQIDGTQVANEKKLEQSASPDHNTQEHRRRLQLSHTVGRELSAEVTEVWGPARRDSTKQRRIAGIAGAQGSHQTGVLLSPQRGTRSPLAQARGCRSADDLGRDPPYL